MKAIILAAGRGVRMKEMTDNIPKCLLTLEGKTLLKYQIEAFQDIGINEISIVTGYKTEMLKNYDLLQFHNEQWSKTNMVTSLLCANEWLMNYECIVSYSDLYYTSDAIELLKNCEYELAITYDPNWLELWSKRFTDPMDDAETFKINKENELIIEIGKTPNNLAQIQGQYMGLIKISPKAWLELKASRKSFKIEDRDSLDMTALLQRVIENGVIPLKGIKYEGKWAEYDCISDLDIKLNQ